MAWAEWRYFLGCCWAIVAVVAALAAVLLLLRAGAPLAPAMVVVFFLVSAMFIAAWWMFTRRFPTREPARKVPLVVNLTLLALGIAFLVLDVRAAFSHAHEAKIWQDVFNNCIMLYFAFTLGRNLVRRMQAPRLL